MPGGARSAAFSSTKAAPARERTNASMYFLFSRKLMSSGPAVSRGATSPNSRTPSSACSNIAPLKAHSASSVNGPARSKKRRSAISARSGHRETLFLLWLRRCVRRRLRDGGSGTWGGERRSGHGEIDRQRRHQFVELLQHLVGNIKALVAKHQVRSLKHQVCLAVLRNVRNDLQHLLLNLGEGLAVGLLQSLALSLNISFEVVDLLLEFTAFLVERVRRHRSLLPLQCIAFGAQRLLLVRDFLGVFVALLLDLAAHHLR